MKKSFKTIIDDSAQSLSSFIISAGKRGYQVEIDPNDLASIIDIEFHDILKHN